MRQPPGPRTRVRDIGGVLRNSTRIAESNNSCSSNGTWKEQFNFYLLTKANLAESTARRLVQNIAAVSRRYRLKPERLSEARAYEIKFDMISRRCSVSYLNKTLDAFNHWFAMHGENVKLKLLPRVRTVPRFLDMEKAQRLLAACESPRDRALIAVLLYGGLRASEACKLTLEDVDLDKRLLRIREPKNGIEDHVVISDKCRETLKEYLESNDYNRAKEALGGRLFYGFVDGSPEKAIPLTYNAIRMVLRRLSEKIGFHVNAHALRHTLGTQLVANGCDISFVQKQLRHRQISTTLIYVHVNKEMLRKAYDKFVPEF